MLHKSIVVPSHSSGSSRSHRRPLRWASRGGGALLASAFAHAMAAVTVGVVLRSIPRGPAAAPDAVDVDVATLVNSPADEPPPATEASRRVDKEAVGRRFAATRRMKAIPAQVSTREPRPSTLSTPVETAEPARFALSAGTVATRAGASLPTAAASPGSVAAGDSDEVSERDVNVRARLLSSSPLVYPAAARQAQIEIDLPVEIVVAADGRVAAARALTRAGYGLDEAALHAIRQYRFSPALRGGRPVRVRMRWTVQFRLR